MAKSTIALAICAALATTTAAAPSPAIRSTHGGYSALVNPGTGKCVVADTYDWNTHTWTLTTGPCNPPPGGKQVVQFAYDASIQTLRTSNGNCLTPLYNTNKGGALVGVAPCNTCSSYGSQWGPLSSTKQWRNGFGLCLDFNSNSDSLVQANCQASPQPGSMQQWALRSAAPSPSPSPSATQTCGAWAVTRGGGPNACPSNMLYSPDNEAARCAANGSNCVSVCCKNTLYGDSQQ